MWPEILPPTPPENLGDIIFDKPRLSAAVLPTSELAKWAPRSVANFAFSPITLFDGAPENTLAASAAEPLRATLVNQRNGPAVFSAFRAYSDGW